MSPAAGARNFTSPTETRCGTPGVRPAPSRGARPPRLLARGWWLQPTLSWSNPRRPGERERSASQPPFSKASGSLEPGGEQHQLHLDGTGRGFLKGGELWCTCRPGSPAVSAKVPLPDPDDLPGAAVPAVVCGRWQLPASRSLPTGVRADPWDCPQPHSAPGTGQPRSPVSPWRGSRFSRHCRAGPVCLATMGPRQWREMGQKASARISHSLWLAQGATPSRDGTGPSSSRCGSAGGCRGAGRSGFLKNPFFPPLSK